MLFWSTGFVVARYGTRDASPLAFLAVRLVVAAALLAVLAAALRSPRPDRRTSWWTALAGVGMHALYLGGVFVAIYWGMPSGVSALIAGLHPVVVTVAARGLLGERVSRVQWLGICLGVGGVAVVVVERLSASSGGVTASNLAASAVSVVGMCGGTLVQRRHGREMPLLWGTVVQYSASAAVLAAGAAAMGWRFDITAQSVLAMSWAVVVLSLGAVLLMLWLLQRRAASQVSSLFFLTPALSTLEGAVLFGERLSPAALVAFAAALGGVALTMRGAAAAPPAATRAD